MFRQFYWEKKHKEREAWEMRISCLLFFGFIFWKNMKLWIAFWLVVVQVMNRKIFVSSSLWSVSEAWRHEQRNEDSNSYMGPIYFCNPQPICFPCLWETSTSVLQKKERVLFFVVCLRSTKAWTEKWRKIAISTWAPFTSVILNLFVSLGFGKHLHQSFR